MDSRKRDLRALIRTSRIGSKSRIDPTPLLATPEFADAKVIASYRSYGDEPETGILNSAILDGGWTLLLPRTDRSGRITFVRWDGDSNKLARNVNVEEPIGEAYEGAIDVVIAPSLAADRSGNRLGQGGGSYDRALLGSSAWRVTILNSGELLDELPTEEHDQKIDAILLPDGLLRI